MSTLFVFAWVFRMFAYQMRNLQGHSRCLPTIYSLHLEFYMFAHSIVNMICINMFFQEVCAWNICCVYWGIRYVAYKIYIAFTRAFCMFAYSIVSILFAFTWFSGCLHMKFVLPLQGHSRCLPAIYSLHLQGHSTWLPTVSSVYYWHYHVFSGDLHIKYLLHLQGHARYLPTIYSLHLHMHSTCLPTVS